MTEETEASGEGRRRIVLHPRTAAARRVDRTRSFGSHVRGFTVQTEEVFALVDSQRRAAVAYLLTAITPIALTLASFVVAPGLTDGSFGGVPVPWLLLGPAALFSIVLVAWRHERRALSIEDRWCDDYPGDGEP